MQALATIAHRSHAHFVEGPGLAVFVQEDGATHASLVTQRIAGPCVQAPLPLHLPCPVRTLLDPCGAASIVAYDDGSLGYLTDALDPRTIPAPPIILPLTEPVRFLRADPVSSRQFFIVTEAGRLLLATKTEVLAQEDAPPNGAAPPPWTLAPLVSDGRALVRDTGTLRAAMAPVRHLATIYCRTIGLLEDGQLLVYDNATRQRHLHVHPPPTQLTARVCDIAVSQSGTYLRTTTGSVYVMEQYDTTAPVLLPVTYHEYPFADSGPFARGPRLPDARITRLLPDTQGIVVLGEDGAAYTTGPRFRDAFGSHLDYRTNSPAMYRMPLPGPVRAIAMNAWCLAVVLRDGALYVSGRCGWRLGIEGLRFGLRVPLSHVPLPGRASDVRVWEHGVSVRMADGRWYMAGTDLGRQGEPLPERPAGAHTFFPVRVSG